MRWLPIDLDADRRLLPSAGQPAVNPLDPYFAWAVLSGWRGYTNAQQPDSMIAFVAERDRTAPIAPDLLSALQLTPASSGTEAPARFVTARFPRDFLGELRGLAAFRRWELAAPVAAADPGVPFVPQFKEGEPLIGVIDDGLAVLNRVFEARGAGPAGTRVVSLWDQGVAHGEGSPDAWKPPAGQRYGRSLDMTRVDAYIQARAAAQLDGTLVEDEAEVYRRWGYLVAPAERDVWHATHGTHVASVVAGNFDPVEGENVDDAASSARIAFVGLPSVTAADPSGGSLSAHVMDALQHLVAMAPASSPVVVVLSYGQHAGPHDGSSILECAMDELLQRHQGRLAIVLGAGNSRRAGGCFAARVKARGKACEIRWNVPRRDRTDSFCEIWYRSVDGSPPTGVRVTVTDPLGRSAVADIDGAGVLRHGSDVVASLIHRAKVPNGKDSMVLLALGPSDAAAGPGAPAGEWIVSVSVASGSDIELHAYVEREDPIEEPDSPESGFAAGSVEQGTLNGIATGMHTLVAGGLRASDRTAADYSSLGPARNAARGPHAWATCEESPSLPGVRGAAVRSGESFRMAGTSVAAPALARLLAEALSTPQGAPDKSGDWGQVLATLAQRHPHRLSVQAPPDPQE